MEYTTFVRKPFTVEAVKVTAENIEELAPMIGKLEMTTDGPFILVDRNKVPNVVRVFPGFWVTKMGPGTKNVRCYSERVFEEQFTSMTPEIQTWVDYMNQQKAEEAPVNG